jgi:hypothetical protein
MTMMTLAFWKTIEQVLGLATNDAEWRERLADCLPHAERYLKQTSRFVDQVSCPFPGGQNCPRHVIRHRDGAVRAVCGDPHKICDALDLSLSDIRMVELDRRRLSADMARALNLVSKDGHSATDRIMHLGDHIAAGSLGFPVFACLQIGGRPISTSDLADLGRRNLPYVIIVSSLESVATQAHAVARGQRGRVITFGECLQFASTPNAGLVPCVPPLALFAPEIAALTTGAETRTRSVMSLPADAKWSELQFTFIADEVLNVRYRNQPSKRIEPDQLGMKDRKSGKATRQWRLLQLCAGLEGALPRSFPVQTIRGERPNGRVVRALADFQSGYARQRQLLASALKARFGIDQDPFSASEDCYEARFLLDANGLKQGRADQRNRNFGEEA